MDFDTLTQESVTFRDLDTMKQVRIKIDEVPDVLIRLGNATITWDAVQEKYPQQSAQAEKAE